MNKTLNLKPGEFLISLSTRISFSVFFMTSWSSFNWNTAGMNHVECVMEAGKLSPNNWTTNPARKRYFFKEEFIVVAEWNKESWILQLKWCKWLELVEFVYTLEVDDFLNGMFQDSCRIQNTPLDLGGRSVRLSWQWQNRRDGELS